MNAIKLHCKLLVIFFGTGLLANAEKPISKQTAANLFKKSCVQCHGAKAEGLEALKTPALASQSTIYLTEQLRKFKNGQRGSDAKKDPVANLMSHQAKVLETKEIQGLALYLTSLEGPEIKQNTTASAQRGKLIYQKRANCISCHGLYGEGNESMKAPKLNILSSAYIESALKKFSQAKRGTDHRDIEGKLMVKVINDYVLSEQDFKDLANYLSGLKN